MGVFQPCYTPAISFTTVPAIIMPATDGTKAMLPVVRCFPGSLFSLPSSGNMAGSLDYTTFTPRTMPRFFNSLRTTRARGQTEVSLISAT